MDTLQLHIILKAHTYLTILMLASALLQTLVVLVYISTITGYSVSPLYLAKKYETEMEKIS